MNADQAYDLYTEIATIYGFTAVTLYDYKREFQRFYSYCVAQHGEGWDMRDATPTDVHGYMTWSLERGKKATTVNRSRDALSSLYKVLVGRGTVKSNPVSMVRKIRAHATDRPYLTFEDAIKFIHEIDDSQIQLIARTLLYTGMRVGEVTTLCVCHVDLENAIVRVVGKGRRQRQVPIHTTEVLPYLREYHRGYLLGADPYAPFFQRPRSGRVSAGTINQVLRKTSSKLKTSAVVTCHTFRHSFATDYLYRGGKIHELRYVLGHQHIATTAKYLHVHMNSIRLHIEANRDGIANERANTN